MKGSTYCSCDSGDVDMGTTSDCADKILNLKYSDLPSSEYNCFMCGIQDERAFEEFKQDLRDFQKLKNNRSTDAIDGCADSDNLLDFNELQLICRPNYVCNNRKGQSRKSLQERKQKPLQSTGRVLLRPPLPACASSLKPTDINDKEPSRDSSEQSGSEQSYKSLRADKSESLVRRADFNKSSLLDIESNCGIEPRANDVLGGFLDDENFKEFERVFETVRNRRVSKDFDASRRLSCKRRSGSCKQFDNENSDRTPKNVQDLSQKFVSDLFLDFFDNDESFLEFEKEFDNFRSNRRSHFLDSLNMGSTQDIFDDLKICCDINMNSNLESCDDSSPYCSQDETVHVDCDEIMHRKSGISSAEDLRQVFRKVKSRLHFDINKPGRVCLHRHSIDVVPEIEHCTEGHRLNHSLDDLIPGPKLDMTTCPSASIPSKGSSKVEHPVGGFIQSALLNLGEKQAYDRPSCHHTRNREDDSLFCSFHYIRLNNEGEANSRGSYLYTNNEDCSLIGKSSYLYTNIDNESLSDRSRYLHMNNDENDSLIGKSSLLHTNKNNDDSLKSSLSYLHMNNDENDSLIGKSSLLHTNKNNDDSLKSSLSYLHMNNDENDSANAKSFFIHGSTDDASLKRTLSFRHVNNYKDDSPLENSSFLHVINNKDDSPWENAFFLHNNKSDCLVVDTSSVLHISERKDESSKDRRAADSNGRDSPSSDHCSSPSCFCRSDLYIEEPCDEVSVDAGPSRSQSLMELDSQSRHGDGHLLHTTSLNNLSLLKAILDSDRLLNDCHRRLASNQDVLTKHTGDFGLDHNYIFTDSQENRPSSAASSEHSDADSETYHTATSDLSGRYSTAKSHLSVFVGKPESQFCDGGANLDLFEKCSPTADMPEDVLDVAELQSHQPLVRGECHRYGGGDSRAGSACQYTCHEHCVSAVTLSCKSVSGDGCDVSAASSPSTPSPQPLLTNIRARPGSAVIVPRLSSTTKDTPAESIPSFQKISPRMGRKLGIHQELAHGYMDTPRASNLSTHLRPWSVREDLLTSHTPDHSAATDPGHETSEKQLISSPQCLSTYSDNYVGSQHHTHSPKQLQPHSGLNTPSSVSFGGSVNKDTQGDVSIVTISHARNVDLPAVELPMDRTDEEVNPDAATEKDETDSGYRSGTIPDDKLPRVPSQTTLDQQELIRKVAKYNHFVPAVSLEVTGKESFQGFLKVTMNLIRPITMELGARPPSIYELLTREHIIEENTQHVAFYMPRDTHKSLHITSDTTTKEVIASLLKKFHILDHPRKFAMYDQEFNDRNKLVRLRRLTDKDCPLRAMVNWDPERIRNYRMVLQENETGEIVWDAFSLPELNNFMRVLDREEKETIIDLKHKYAYMKQYIERRLVELRTEYNKTKNNT